jgi:hypothetical protein
MCGRRTGGREDNGEDNWKKDVEEDEKHGPAAGASWETSRRKALPLYEKPSSKNEEVHQQQQEPKDSGVAGGSWDIILTIHIKRRRVEWEQRNSR